jgi:hypothetical protein
MKASILTSSFFGGVEGKERRGKRVKSVRCTHWSLLREKERTLFSCLFAHFASFLESNTTETFPQLLRSPTPFFSSSVVVIIDCHQRHFQTEGIVSRGREEMEDVGGEERTWG